MPNRRRALPTTSYAVLGLLSTGPMSGYQLARFAEESIAHFWPISKSRVYTELPRLEELGYVQGSDVRQDKVPDKRTYELTAAGERVLTGWLAEPSYEAERTRIGFLVKVFFGDRIPAVDRVALLEEYRQARRAERDDLARIVDVLEPHPETVFMRATALFGLRTAEAHLAWCDEIEPLFRSGGTGPSAPATGPGQQGDPGP